MANVFAQFVDDAPQENVFAQFVDESKDTPPTEQEASKPTKGIVSDTILNLGQGALKLPAAAAGLADIPLGLAGLNKPISRASDYIADKTGLHLTQFAEDANKDLSPQLQESKNNINQAWDQGGAGNIAKTYLNNPRATLATIAESVPMMFTSGVLGKALGTILPAMADTVVAGNVVKSMAPARFAAGDAALTAGDTMSNIDASVDPRKAALSSAADGVFTGAVDLASGHLANKLGLENAGNLAAGQRLNQGAREGAKPLSTGLRFAGGTALEAGEEALQNPVDQMSQNYAENKPLMEGVPRAAVEGILAGGVMGGGSNILSTIADRSTKSPDQADKKPDTTSIDGSLIDSSTPEQLALPELVFTADGRSFSKKELIDGFKNNGADDQQALNYLSAITAIPVEHRTPENLLSTYTALQEKTKQDQAAAQEIAAHNQYMSNRANELASQPALSNTVNDSAELDANAQSDQALAFHEKEQADLAQKDAELKAMGLRTENTPEQTREYRKKRLELRAQSDQLNQDLAEALRTSSGEEAKNTQLSDQLHSALNVKPRSTITSNLPTTDHRSDAERAGTPTGASDSTPTEGLNHDQSTSTQPIPEQSQQASGSRDQEPNERFNPTHQLEDGTPLVKDGDLFVNQAGNYYPANASISPITQGNHEQSSQSTPPDAQEHQRTPTSTLDAEAIGSSANQGRDNTGTETVTPFVDSLGIKAKKQPDGRFSLRRETGAEVFPALTFGTHLEARDHLRKIRKELTNEDTTGQVEVPKSGDVVNPPSLQPVAESDSQVTKAVSQPLSSEAATPHEIAAKNTQAQLPNKLFDNPIKSLGGLSVRGFVADKVNENTQFSEDNGKFYIGGTTGAGKQQVTKAVHTYGQAYKAHLNTAIETDSNTDTNILVRAKEAISSEHITPFQKESLDDGINHIENGGNVSGGFAILRRDLPPTEEFISNETKAANDAGQNSPVPVDNNAVTRGNEIAPTVGEAGSDVLGQEIAATQLRAIAKPTEVSGDVQMADSGLFVPFDHTVRLAKEAIESGNVRPTPFQVSEHLNIGMRDVDRVLSATIVNQPSRTQATETVATPQESGESSSNDQGNKQPWEMTKADLQKNEDDIYKQQPKPPKKKDSGNVPIQSAYLDAKKTWVPKYREAVKANDDVQHEAIIKQALAEGKSVPQEVLEDYPHLKASAQQSPEPIHDNADVHSKLDSEIDNLSPTELEAVAKDLGVKTSQFNNGESAVKQQHPDDIRAALDKVKSNNANVDTDLGKADEITQAKDDITSALSEIGEALSNKVSRNALPSDADLQKAVLKLIKAAIKLGYIKLSDNVSYVMAQLKAKFGDAVSHIDEQYLSKLFKEVEASLEGKNATTGNLDRVNADVREAVAEFLLRRPADEQVRISDNLKAHVGTAWAAAAVKGMAYREMLHRAMEGRNIDNLTTNDIWGGQDMANTKIIKHFRKYPKFGDKIIHSLISQYDFVGGNRKAENDVSTSFANCNPSDECAVHCYAAGSNARPNEIAKSEFTEFVLEHYLQQATDRIANTYKYKEAGLAGLSLRLNDKGDLSEAQLQLISGLNDKGIVLQIFSKRPDLLRKMSDSNLKMLSIDESNMNIAVENPDLRLAVVITDGMTEAMLSPIHDRVSVYLPVNLKGKSVSTTELKSRFPTLYPKMKRDNLCPVDGGNMITLPGTSFVDIQNGVNKGAEEKVWTCTACDAYGAVGCFKGDRQTTQRNAATQEQVINFSDVKKELAIKNARIELQKQLDLLQSLGDINGKQHKEISGIISAGQSDIRLDANRGTETVRSKGEGSTLSGHEESRGRIGRDDSGRGETGRTSGESKDVKFSKSQPEVTNPHTKSTLHAAIGKALDKVFGQGWTQRLEATGKFKFISRDEAIKIAGNQASDAKGFYDANTDTTYFVHDNISKDASNKALLKLVLHEVGVHALQMGKTNEAFQALLKRFEAMKKTNPKVQAAFDSVPSDTKAEDKLEEALAYFIEHYADSTIAQRIVEAFRQLVRAIGNNIKGMDKLKFMQWANKLTETELQNMAVSALRNAPSDLQFDNVGREAEGVKFVKVPQSDITLGQKANDPVKVNGEADIWIIPEEVESRTKGRFLAKPVRLLMGKHFGENRGFGLTHIEAGHSKEIAATGMTTEQWVVSVIKSATKIVDNGSGRLIVYSAKAPKGAAFIELRNDGDFYSVVTAYHTEPKGKIVWSGRRHLISSEGSNVSGTQGTVATTTGSPINPTVRTDTIADKSSAQSRETLTDQTTDENIAQNNEGNNNIKFSRSTPTNTPASKSMAGLADQARQFIANHTDSAKTFNWWHNTIGTQAHKATVDGHFKKVFEASMAMEESTAKFANAAADRSPSLLPKLEGLKSISDEILKAQGWKRNKDAKAIGQAIFQTTLDDKPLTEAELVAQGYTAKQRTMYHEFFAAINQSMDDLAKSEMLREAKALSLVPANESLSLKDTASFYADQVDDANIIKSFFNKAEQIKKLQDQGYAPLMRFGQYTLDVNETLADGTEKRVFFGLFESQAEANEMAAAMQSEYPEATIAKGIMSQQDWQLFKGITPETMEVFAKLMNVDKDVAFQEYLKSAVNNRSALKRLIHRKKMPGFAADPQRVLASFITSNAKASAKNIHLGDMVKAITDIPKAKGDVLDEAVNLYNYVQNPSEKGAAIRGLLFTWYLGGSVASAMVNLTQTLTTTTPYLHQFGETQQVARIMAKAMKLAALKSGAISGDLGKALKLAGEEGVTEPQELHMLYGESMRTGVIQSQLLRPLTKAWGSLFSLAESYNRRVAFIAAYTLAKETNKPDAFAFAAKAVNDTQFIYNKSARPNWSRSTVGSMVFTFKTFSINYLEFLKQLPPKERLIALGILMVLSGLSGLPGDDDADDIIDSLGQGLGYNTNTKSWKQSALSDMVGKTAANYMLHGISAGLPVDLSQRLGAGNLIPGSALFKRSETNKTRDIAEFVGPVGGLFTKGMDAFDAAQTRQGLGNKLSAVGKAIVPKAISDAWQGLDMLQSGQYKDVRGKKIVNTDASDALFKAIGLQPTSVAEQRRAERYLTQDVQLTKSVESDIAGLWTQGLNEKDQDKVKEAQSLLKDWNDKNHDTPIRISHSQIVRRVKQMRLSSRDRLLKTAPKELRRYANQLLANEE